MELPKSEEISGSKSKDAQPENNPDTNANKNEITEKAIIKVENNEMNGESLSAAIASELKKDSVGENIISTNPKPVENGIVSESLKKESEIIATNDREFVLTTKNLERVREDLRQEEALQGKKSSNTPKSVSASPIKQELVKSESKSAPSTPNGHKSSSSHRHSSSHHSSSNSSHHRDKDRSHHHHRDRSHRDSHGGSHRSHRYGFLLVLNLSRA